jgi:hypothetical protein
VRCTGSSGRTPPFAAASSWRRSRDPSVSGAGEDALGFGDFDGKERSDVVFFAGDLPPLSFTDCFFAGDFDVAFCAAAFFAAAFFFAGLFFDAIGETSYQV